MIGILVGLEFDVVGDSGVVVVVEEVREVSVGVGVVEEVEVVGRWGFCFFCVEDFCGGFVRWLSGISCSLIVVFR